MCFMSCESATKYVNITNTTPLKAQFVDSHATYIIKGVVNLKGDTINIPADSKLKFKKKGLLTNGVIKGKNTLIMGKPNIDHIRLKGTFQNQEFCTSWCSSLSMSDYIEDVMNLAPNTVMIVNSNIKLGDNRKYVDHLTLIGKGGIITNSDRFYIMRGGVVISNLKFRWNMPPVVNPVDNYSAVVIYHDLLEKDTTVNIQIKNVDANGGKYCSFFMRQYKSKTNPKLRTNNTIMNCNFYNFTKGAIWTCGGSGKIYSSNFTQIGYDKSEKLYSVTALRLGYDHITKCGRALGYIVEDCFFERIVAAYNFENDGRELHGLLAYGDSIIVRNNTFRTLSTNFSKTTDAGRDSEMLYIKGSYNIIEDNTFENGVGYASDGVVTLKVGTTEGNIVRNNKFFLDNTAGKFIYLGGHKHIIEGNSFVSTCSSPQDNYSYAIYLGHKDNDNIKESAIIRNNTFFFTEKNNYMAVYANRWGDLIMTDNTFNNPTKLLKCNNRDGEVLIKNNTITLNRIQGSNVDNFIEITGSSKYPAIISNNIITLTNSSSGRLVKGSNYCFYSNTVSLKNTKLQTLLQGNDTDLKDGNNSISIDKTSKVTK